MVIDKENKEEEKTERFVEVEFKNGEVIRIKFE